MRTHGALLTIGLGFFALTARHRAAAARRAAIKAYLPKYELMRRYGARWKPGEDPQHQQIVRKRMDR